MKLVKNQLYYEEILNQERKSDGSKEDIEKLEKIKISNNSILKEYNSRDFATSVYFSIKKRRKKYMQNIVSLCGFFLICIVGLNLNVDLVRMKGDSSVIKLYKKVNGENKIVEESDSFKQGDVLQITYFTSKWKYGSIISLDGDGVATLHYPSTFQDDGYLINDTEAILPYSYQLDDAKGFERFYFIVSDKSFDIEEVYKRIQLGENLENSKGYHIAEVVEVKKD